MSILKSFLSRAGNLYSRIVCRREFDSQVFEGLNERGVEYRFVFEHIAHYCPTKVLDVGTGKSALPHLMRNCGCLVTSVDNVRDYWPKGMANRHYYVLQDDILHSNLQREEYDLVTCVSVLEHIGDHRKAVTSMIQLLKPGGYLIISFPFNERHYIENVYALPGSVGADKYPFSTQVFSRRELDEWCSDGQVRLVKQEYWRFFTGEFWTLGEPLCPPELADADSAHQIACILLRRETLK